MHIVTYNATENQEYDIAPQKTQSQITGKHLYFQAKFASLEDNCVLWDLWKKTSQSDEQKKKKQYEN